MRILTPAKLNLGLEVLGKRDDGYHDIATIFQAVSIFDEMRYLTSPSFAYRGDPRIDEKIDLARPILERAALQQGWQGELQLSKQIPLAAGLGGGSSNAALALRLESVAHGDGLDVHRALSIGSDIPFFLQGGTARGTGRGERLVALPTMPVWFVVHTPELTIARKTEKLFASLRPNDFTDGQHVAQITKSMLGPVPTLPEILPNVFERYMRSFDLVQYAWQILMSITGRVALSGAGPSIFTWHESEPDATGVAEKVRAMLDGSTFICRAIPRHTNQESLEQVSRQLRSFRR